MVITLAVLAYKFFTNHEIIEKTFENGSYIGFDNLHQNFPCVKTLTTTDEKLSIIFGKNVNLVEIQLYDPKAPFSQSDYIVRIKKPSKLEIQSGHKAYVFINHYPIAGYLFINLCSDPN